MAQPLFIEPDLYFEKVSSETSLPEDPNQWPNAILQELYKQVPYVADFEPRIEMEKVDAERGFGFGHVEIGNKTEAPMNSPGDQQEAAGLRMVRIPIIIAESKLQPFDVIVTEDAKMVPLTDTRLRESLFRPHTFDVTSKTPGDQSMIGQLYPPYRQNYGFGGGGVSTNAGGGGKTASARDVELEGGPSELDSWLAKEAQTIELEPGTFSVRNLSKEQRDKEAAATQSVVAGAAKKLTGAAPPPVAGTLSKSEPFALPSPEMLKTQSVLESILPTINQTDHARFMSVLSSEPGLQAAFMKNASATAPFLKMLVEHEPFSNEKVAQFIPQTVKPTVFQVRKAEDGYVIKTASRYFWAPIEEVVGRGEAVARCGEKVVLAADMSGAVTAAEGDTVQEDPLPEKAEIITEPGTYKVKDDQGKDLIGVVIPNLLDVDGEPLPISLFHNGSQTAVQSDIVGYRVGEATNTPWCEVGGKGVFCTVSNGKQVCTIPFDVKGKYSVPSKSVGEDILAETFDGRQVTLSVQPGIKRILESDGKILIPDWYRWMPLEESEELSLMSDQEQFDQVNDAKLAMASVELRSGGADSFSIDGYAVEKIASEDRHFISQDEAIFLLSGLGTHPNQARTKIAEAFAANRPARVRIGNHLKMASDVRKEASRKADAWLSKINLPKFELWKEAAIMPDPVAVDTVLSIGFLNPENIAQFIGYLPVIEDAQQRLSELLIASRLGLKEMPKEAIEKAIRSVEVVIEGLKVIAFQE